MKLWLLCIALSIAVAGCDGPSTNDFDGDGSVDSVDCAPDDPSIHPAATELCSDGIDNDCDGWIDCTDGDCLLLAECDSGDDDDSIGDDDDTVSDDDDSTGDDDDTVSDDDDSAVGDDDDSAGDDDDSAGDDDDSAGDNTTPFDVDLTDFNYPHFGNGTDAPHFADQQYLSADTYADSGTPDASWHNGVTAPIPAYAAIEMPSPTLVNSLNLLIREDGPRSLFFEGSNDSTDGLNGTWTTLGGPYVDLSLPSPVTWMTEPITNTSTFTMYRLRDDSGVGFIVFEWEMLRVSN